MFNHYEVSQVARNKSWVPAMHIAVPPYSSFEAEASTRQRRHGAASRMGRAIARLRAAKRA